VSGEVRVYPHTDRPERFEGLRRVYLGSSGTGADPRRVERASVAPSRIIIKLGGIDTREDAETLRGRDLLIPADEVWPLPDGHYYHFQLVGLAVRDVAGSLRGRVSRIYPGPANDFYAVQARPEGPEELIPATRQVVRSIDLEEGLMVVDWPEPYEQEEPSATRKAAKGKDHAR